jgi:hypothetical protein
MKLPFAALAVSLLAPAALAVEPVYLSPGQCILVGGQQICALASDAQAHGGAPAAPGVIHTDHVCRYALHAHSETPDVKNYAVVRVDTLGNGKKIEMIQKQYGVGDADKASCEKDAASRTAP